MLNKKVILYIEDDPINRLLIQRILLADGFVMLEASDSVSALALLEFSHPDLILMDINLPEVDGYTLTAKIRDLPGLKSVPIIALTANVMRGDRERTLEAGCDGYIQKPIDVDLLPEQIRKYLQETHHD